MGPSLKLCRGKLKKRFSPNSTLLIEFNIFTKFCSLLNIIVEKGHISRKKSCPSKIQILDERSIKTGNWTFWIFRTRRFFSSNMIHPNKRRPKARYRKPDIFLTGSPIRVCAPSFWKISFHGNDALH